MMNTIVHRLRSGIVVALIVLSLPIVAAAGTLTMYLTDLDVTYLGSAPNGGAIYDAISLNGGNFNTSESDRLQAASFELDGLPLTTLVDTSGSTSDDMWGDLRVNGIGATVPRNTINFALGNNGGTFGFDWFIKPVGGAGAPTNFLRLGITNVNVSLTDIPAGGEAFTFTGLGTVLSQNLPSGAAFNTGQQVAFSYTAPKAGLSGGSPATGALGSGAITITGSTVVPEPASVALLCSGGLMLGIGVLRRNSRSRAAA
jgi:hypothetical protein